MYEIYENTIEFCPIKDLLTNSLYFTHTHKVWSESLTFMSTFQSLMYDNMIHHGRFLQLFGNIIMGANHEINFYIYRYMIIKIYYSRYKMKF